MACKIVTRRNKTKSIKSILLNLSVPLFFIIITLCALPLYTPWIFNKSVKATKEWFPNPFHFVSSHKKIILDENITSFSNVLFSKEPEENISIPTEKIWIEDGGLEKMNHQLLLWNLPSTDEAFKVTKRKKPKVKGFFMGPQKKYYQAKINIRGTRPTHQMVWKPSLKIRLKRKKIHKGFRVQTLIAPEDVLGLKNWISAELGKRWNVLNNREDFVRLTINNKDFGLYNKVAPFNESLLIQSNRLPGPIFNFNIFNKQIFNIWKKQWFDPIAWKTTEKKYKVLMGANPIISRPLKIASIVTFWEQFQKASITEYLRALNQYISQDQFAKYLAILNHAGERHYLDNHNALFWLNPSSGLMEPIINDQNGYGISNSKKWTTIPIIKNKGAFVKAWFKNPLNQAIYTEKLYEIINTIGNENNMEQIIHRQWKEIRPVLQSETALSYSCSPAICFFPVNQLDQEVDNLINDINLRLHWIRKELNRDKVLLIEKNKDDFEILTLGFSGVRAQRKDKERFRLSNLKLPTKYNSNLINLNGVKNANLLPSKSILDPSIEEVHFNHSYSFYTLTGDPSDYIFYHRLSGKEIKIKNSITDLDVNKMKALSGVNYLNFEEEDMTPIIFGPGKVEILESKIFNLGQPVIIKAGTEIYLSKNVQIVVQGPLKIEGTRKNSVIIKPIDPKQPFGVLALLGKKTKGSKISFLSMEGGSVGIYYNLKFSGMFSVHDCPNIEIKNSKFGKNAIGDDAVHIINSTATIRNSIFQNSKMDALDLDLVNGNLFNNQFINPGNDGLDLSMGNVTINKNRFIGCKDKCISAGEGVKAHIKNSYIQNCNIGIAVKDKSFVTLNSSIIDSCNVGWNSYRKKWRWELGGKGKIINTNFINSKSADIAGDKLSAVSIFGQNIADLNIKGKINTHPIY